MRFLGMRGTSKDDPDLLTLVKQLDKRLTECENALNALTEDVNTVSTMAKRIQRKVYRDLEDPEKPATPVQTNLPGMWLMP